MEERTRGSVMPQQVDSTRKPQHPHEENHGARDLTRHARPRDRRVRRRRGPGGHHKGVGRKGVRRDNARRRASSLPPPHPPTVEREVVRRRSPRLSAGPTILKGSAAGLMRRNYHRQVVRRGPEPFTDAGRLADESEWRVARIAPRDQRRTGPSVRRARRCTASWEKARRIRRNV